MSEPLGTIYVGILPLLSVSKRKFKMLYVGASTMSGHPSHNIFITLPFIFFIKDAYLVRWKIELCG